MSWFKSNKCQICKDRRHHRFCLRTGKDICWECCNKLRYDRNCPSECRYTLTAGKGLEFSKTNADSITEYRDLIRKLMDLWLRLPQDALNGEIPLELAKSEQGEELLYNYINANQLEKVYNFAYLKQKLDLKKISLPPKKDDYESIAVKFLDALIAADYKKALDHYLIGDQIRSNPEWFQDFCIHKQKDPVLKKLHSYKIIASALSENKKEALVYFDVNSRYDLSFRLNLHNNNWFICQQINGKLELINGENDALKQIAILFSKNELIKGEELLKKYLNLYPDSADLYYYKGVSESMQNKKKAAQKSFFRAVRLDPNFAEAHYNYALQLHLSGELEKAAHYYQKALELDPDNIKCINNLAALMIDKKDYQKAEKYLAKCEKIDSSFEPYQKNLARLKDLQGK